MAVMETIRARNGDDLVALNAAAVTVGQLAAAQADGGADLVVAVRLGALDAWIARHDPARTLDPALLLDAAALASLIDTGLGIGFDDARFAELIDFIAELPW